MAPARERQQVDEWRRVPAPPQAPVAPSGNRHGGGRDPLPRRRAGRRSWATVVLMLVGLWAAASVAGYVLHPGLHPLPGGSPSAPAASRSASHSPAPATSGAGTQPGRSGARSAGTGTAPAARTNPGGTAAGVSGASPDCAAMGMQPVTPQGNATRAAVAGLCYSLGSARGWLVGCAPGFQAACDPSLQSVIACVRRIGAAKSGPVTEADVWGCDVPVGASTQAGAAAGTGAATSAPGATAGGAAAG